MNLLEIISNYNLTVVNGTGIKATTRPTNSDVEIIKANKQEIIDIITATKIAREQRDMKINAISGLKKIQDATEEWDRYYYNREIRANDESTSSICIAHPESDIKNLKIEYPRAAAYLLAEDYSFSSDYEKSMIGKTTLEKIINGEDYNTVIAEMESQWAEYCNGNMWN